MSEVSGWWYLGSEGHCYLCSGLTHKCEVDARMSEECEIHESLMSRRVGNPMFQIPETSEISEYLQYLNFEL